MKIDSVTVNDKQQVVLQIGGDERPLPDGVFRSESGQLITVSHGTISDVFAIESPATTDDWVALVEELAAQLLESSTVLDLAVRRREEMLMSFNLRYMALQQDMQAQNRQFTLVSNIMKAKHDTAKNAINNVR